MTALSVVIVSYDSDLSLDAVRRELRDEDELIVVENGTPGEPPPGVRYLAGHGNVGFGAGCNLGARHARSELLVFLNPDAVPQPGWGEAIREPWDGDWVAWQALVLEPGGQTVNSAGNEVHFTGVAWAGQAGRPVSEADLRPREVGFLSGACLAVRAAEFRALKGFCEPYFLYQEDLELSLRLRLAGGRIGLWPAAVAEHDYEFTKGEYKWWLLERNRWFTLLRCWPAPLLVLCAPALAATELAIWAAAVRDGWAGAKWQGTSEVLRLLPWLMRGRRVIRRRIGTAEFAAHLTATVDSEFLPRLPLVNRLLLAYWWLVRTSVSKRPTISGSTRSRR